MGFQASKDLLVWTTLDYVVVPLVLFECASHVLYTSFHDWWLFGPNFPPRGLANQIKQWDDFLMHCYLAHRLTGLPSQAHTVFAIYHFLKYTLIDSIPIR